MVFQSLCQMDLVFEYKNHLKLVTGQLQLQSLFWKNGQLATQIEPGQPIKPGSI
jgi:hypothetical protein